MDRRRTESLAYSRQWSGGSSSTGSSSPAMSPAHPQSRLGQRSGFSTIKRTQNVATKAAAQRLAQVMASLTTDDDDDEDDDLGFRYPAPTAFGNNNANSIKSGSGLFGISFGKPNRLSSPAVGTLWSTDFVQGLCEPLSWSSKCWRVRAPVVGGLNPFAFSLLLAVWRIN